MIIVPCIRHAHVEWGNGKRALQGFKAPYSKALCLRTPEGLLLVGRAHWMPCMSNFVAGLGAGRNYGIQVRCNMH